MILNKKWIIATTLALTIGGVTWVNAEPVEKVEPQQPTKEQQHPGQLSQQEMSSDDYYLPSVSEIYEQAKTFGVSGDWNKIVQIQSQDYKAMKLPRRSFAVGKTLSNIAFLVLDSGNDTAPPKGLVQHAYDAISSLNPPAKINAQLQRLRDQLEAGTLRGKKLRTQVDILLDETVPEILETEPSLKDAGTLVLGAGYFRAMYLGTSTVAGYKNPTRDQLAMFRWGGILKYFITYFTKKAAPEFKNNAEVKSFVIALHKIGPHLNKSPESISKADVTKVAEILKPLFN